MQKAYLTLADGCVYSGFAFGFPRETVGELVFTTSMIGYMETITDPCYAGQIVVAAFPLIGNCGVIPPENGKGKPELAAYIIRDLCDTPSNFMCEGKLEDYLEKNGIPGIYGIDTRSLIRHIRDAGTMAAKITLDAPDTEATAAELSGFVPSHPAECGVSCGTFSGSSGCRAAIWNFGADCGAEAALRRRGCDVAVFSGESAADAIINASPDCVLLSDGAGDPAGYTAAVAGIKKIADAGIPMLGISLGHQLLALAMGGSTAKLPYGHRGANQPTRRLSDGRVFTTTQNHGYAADASALEGVADESYINENDRTCEGLAYRTIPAISVQFRPDDCGGPHDTGYIYDEFLALVKGGCANA